jgi:maltose alpha-D-glucosyltransferase / alpha-amylase
MNRQSYEPLWYKDAVIYQVHVKSFFDGNDDGVGDFAGLTSRLDYLQNLGIDTLWILPFYPSPLKDDGYDISDYRGVHPRYGTMRDFRIFVREAHERGLRVVTELVINHTSDQHPWFQRARRARPGSVYHDYYVWSDDDTKYAGTRIIFTDTEISNWTFDPVAKRYFWHRFFSHQPDLNFDNPRVFNEVANVMRFWFDTGIDGVRLDAIPYLCEREGTSNENLPETHAVIKRLRAIVDKEYPGRFFLAEANQWPEDVRAYFGDGDECHMAFHFPLMPRMFMAIASRDRYPIYDIMRQTPPIPENCQWAIFLRNHDEMTLEMVTDRERAFMYSVYASDLRARVNVGIRRRLAPLMENDRRKIELMTSLLLSMPGTPIVYYGDEIGMGDNIFLGDRDGVRTPMQWSIDRNGGFSRADAQRLYLPIIQDPIYGYASVNVEAQDRSPHSLLNWIRRMIAVRRAHKVFGRGTLTFLYPENRTVLAYVREYEDEAVLCVVNLSDVSQAVELDLTRFAGRVPIEMLGWSPFPKISSSSYVLTMPAHTFFWFFLSEVEAPTVAAPAAALPEFFTVVLRYGFASMMREPGRTTLEREVIPRYLPSRRWFAGKNVAISSVHVIDVCPLGDDPNPMLLMLVEVGDAEGHASYYQLSPAIAYEKDGEYPATVPPSAFARTRRGPLEGLLFDGSADDGFWNALVRAMRRNTRLQGQGGMLVVHGSEALRSIEGEGGEVKRLQAEQSNTSAIIADAIMLKVYRRLQAGIHPEIEMSSYLTKAGYKNTPALLGTIEYVDDVNSITTALGIAHEYVLNQGDGWSMTMTFLKRFLEERHEEGDINPLDVYDRYARILARRLAEMHAILARPTDDPAFKPEPAESDEIVAWGEETCAEADAALDLLARVELPADVTSIARVLLDARSRIIDHIRELARAAQPTVKTRIHGDFHLGQVLVVAEDVLIVDLEGQTQESFEHRRRKRPQLRDVAGILRSFDYAGVASLAEVGPAHADDLDRMSEEIDRWKGRALDAFLSEYEGAAGSIDQNLLDLFLIGKGLYELDYELKNRPAWTHIPIQGLIGVLKLTVGAR